MRTCEALALHHAADGADTLLDAGRCFEQLARTAEAMATLSACRRLLLLDLRGTGASSVPVDPTS